VDAGAVLHADVGNATAVDAAAVAMIVKIVQVQTRTVWVIAAIHIVGVPACERHVIRARNVVRAVR
jgi:hypothetical protein